MLSPCLIYIYHFITILFQLLLCGIQSLILCLKKSLSIFRKRSFYIGFATYHQTNLVLNVPNYQTAFILHFSFRVLWGSLNNFLLKVASGLISYHNEKNSRVYLQRGWNRMIFSLQISERYAKGLAFL